MLLAAGQRGVPCAGYTPQQVKGAVCGSGRAEQGPGGAHGAGRCSGLTEQPRPDHAADALAVALCHANRAPLARARAGRRGSPAMIALLRGEVAVRRADHVVILCGGVGYRAAVSAQTLRARSRGRASTSALHTHLIVRDDALTLYGFHSEEERELFLMLLSVQAVGPKVALAVLSAGAAERAGRRARGRRRRALSGGARASASAPPSGSSSSCARRSACSTGARLAPAASRPRSSRAAAQARRAARARARRPARARLRARRGRGAARGRRGGAAPRS